MNNFFTTRRGSNLSSGRKSYLPKGSVLDVNADKEIHESMLSTINDSYTLQQEYNNKLYKTHLDKLSKELEFLKKQNMTMKNAQHVRYKNLFNENQKLRQQQQQQNQGYYRNNNSNDSDMDDTCENEKNQYQEEEEDDYEQEEQDEPDFKLYTSNREKNKTKKPINSRNKKEKARDLEKEFQKLNSKNRQRISAKPKVKKRKFEE